MAEEVIYRRSNAREALLARAVVHLQEKGEGGLSLREIARELGMSHGAPARHFPDRQGLLDALAIEGFGRLADRLEEVSSSSEDPGEQAVLMAHAYIDFAVSESNLVDVMYQHKSDGRPDAVTTSAGAAFLPLVTVLRRAEDLGRVDAGGAERSATILVAAFQGLALQRKSGVIEPDAIALLVEDIVGRYIAPRA